MKWIEIKTDADLPLEGKYVLARHNRGTWQDKDDQENVNCVVVKLKRGISKKERKLMKEGKLPDFKTLYTSGEYIERSKIETSDDECSNNLKPYSWHGFGCDHFFGQSITHWTPIQGIKK